MTTVAKVIALIALVGTALPSVLFLAGSLTLPTAQTYLLVATICWFVAAPLWMLSKSKVAN